MKILAIGGTLFIGRETVQRLLKRGHDVTVLHRHDQHDLGAPVKNIKADRADLDRVAGALRDGRFDAVFDFVYDWEHGTFAEQIEAAARAAGNQLKRYVFISSIAAYGPGLDRRESDALVPDNYANRYAADKASSERVLFQLNEQDGIPVTTFRPPFVHGPRQPFYREQFFWDRMRDGRPIILPDGGESPIQWVYVNDLAEAMVRALEVTEAAGEAFNIAHTEPHTQRSFIEMLGRVADMTPQFVSIPRAEIQAAGGQVFGGNLYFGEFLDIPVHTSVVEKAPRILGVTPTKIEDAFAQGYGWYQAQPRRTVDYSFEDRLMPLAGRA